MSGSRAKKERHQQPNHLAKKTNRLIREERFFSGPIPSPEVLEKYKNIDPKLVETITQMAVEQQTHRHKMESRDQKIYPFLFIFGQLLGTAIGFAALLGGFYLLYSGKTIEGYTTLVGTVGTLIGIYIYNKKKDSELLAKKNQ